MKCQVDMKKVKFLTNKNDTTCRVPYYTYVYRKPVDKNFTFYHKKIIFLPMKRVIYV